MDLDSHKVGKTRKSEDFAIWRTVVRCFINPRPCACAFCMVIMVRILGLCIAFSSGHLAIAIAFLILLAWIPWSRAVEAVFTGHSCLRRFELPRQR